jgi:hypothetical protein
MKVMGTPLLNQEMKLHVCSLRNTVLIQLTSYEYVNSRGLDTVILEKWW